MIQTTYFTFKHLQKYQPISEKSYFSSVRLLHGCIKLGTELHTSCWYAHSKICKPHLRERLFVEGNNFREVWWVIGFLFRSQRGMHMKHEITKNAVSLTSNIVLSIRRQLISSTFFQHHFWCARWLKWLVRVSTASHDCWTSSDENEAQRIKKSVKTAVLLIMIKFI